MSDVFFDGGGGVYLVQSEPYDADVDVVDES